MTSSGVCSPSERVSGTSRSALRAWSAVKRMPFQLGPLSGETAAAHGHPHRYATARPDIAGSIEVCDGDALRNSARRPERRRAPARRSRTIGSGGGIERFGIGRTAVGEDEDPERKAVAKSAGELLERPIQPGFIGCRAQSVVEIGEPQFLAEPEPFRMRGSAASGSLVRAC